MLDWYKLYYIRWNSYRKNCVVGANSLVKGQFPDYSVIAGSPAKIIKRYDINPENWIRIKIL